MATMIPNRSLEQIKNAGERSVYEAARSLPDDYTVIHSFYFQRDRSLAQAPVRYEGDFIIFHPDHGLVVVEVKTGPLRYENGSWVRGREAVTRTPEDQIDGVLGYIRDRFAELANVPKNRMPFGWARVICLPLHHSYQGDYPPGFDARNFWLSSDVQQLEKRFRALLPAKSRMTSEHQQILLDRILDPMTVPTTDPIEVVNDFHRDGERLLTDEQLRFLETTAENRQMLVLGGAGTGKTHIAIAKAKELLHSGKRVFSTWYNVKLTHLYREEARLTDYVAEPFTEYLNALLTASGDAVPRGETQAEKDRYWKELLPAWGETHFMECSEDERFDAILVDEAQDFFPSWFACLQRMLKPGGCFYVFADPGQNVFGAPDLLANEFLVGFPRFTLTRNLRNATKIADTLRLVEPSSHSRTLASFSGMVEKLVWDSPVDERLQIERRVDELLAQGYRPNQIAILTFDRRHNTCLADVVSLAGVPLSDESSDVERFLEQERNLIDTNAETQDHIMTTTIRRYKGLEADFVFLVGAVPNSQRCTRMDLYVGASRARYHLVISHRRDWQMPVIKGM